MQHRSLPLPEVKYEHLPNYLCSLKLHQSCPGVGNFSHVVREHVLQLLNQVTVSFLVPPSAEAILRLRTESNSGYFPGRGKSSRVSAPPAGWLDGFCSRWDSLLKAKRVLAWCLRYLANLRRKRERSPLLLTQLSVQELRASMLHLLHVAQYKSFKELILQIRSETPVATRWRHLKPQLSQDMVLSVSPMDGRRRALLSNGSPLASLMAREAHLANGHCGGWGVLAELGRKYWIYPSARGFAAAAVLGCAICSQDSSEFLPDLRRHLAELAGSQPFTLTAVDFYGPLVTHHEDTRRKWSVAYVAVFACLKSTAVHLELVPKASLGAVLEALGSFSAHWSSVRTIYSDGGAKFGPATGLVRLASLLRRKFNDIHKACVARGILWKHVPSSRLQFNKLWDNSMVCAMTVLHSTLSNAEFSASEHKKVLDNTQAIWNSRPLTAATDDPQDLEVVTPGSFLAELPALPSSPRCFDVDNATLDFWAAWRLKYVGRLPALVNSAAMVVLLAPALSPLRWTVGRVVAVTRDNTGRAHQVTVKTKQGISQQPIELVLLCPPPFGTLQPICELVANTGLPFNNWRQCPT